MNEQVEHYKDLKTCNRIGAAHIVPECQENRLKFPDRLFRVWAWWAGQEKAEEVREK